VLLIGRRLRWWSFAGRGTDPRSTAEYTRRVMTLGGGKTREMQNSRKLYGSKIATRLFCCELSVRVINLENRWSMEDGGAVKTML
jgi:hypothetical protein